MADTGTGRALGSTCADSAEGSWPSIADALAPEPQGSGHSTEELPPLHFRTEQLDRRLSQRAAVPPGPSARRATSREAAAPHVDGESGSTMAPMRRLDTTDVRAMK